ncbi:MAG: ribose-phosphate pyrophosphokinase [Deltaproteobacteria bacterium]|nr:ribose-phosphate pyrophosphokinase [Deltaproteobacteria bacterium]
MNNKFKIISGNANRPLAQKIAESLNTKLLTATVTRFSDGESWVEIEENVRGDDVFVIQPTNNPANENLMELLIIIDCLKRASANHITAVLPYYGYARQDRKTSPRTPISSKLVADLITAAGAHRILTMDLHAGQIQGFFNIPVDHLFAKPVLIDYLKGQLQNNVIMIAPDAGGAERARSYAKILHCPMALIDKRRPRPNVNEVMNIIGDVSGMRAIIIDDIVDTAGTMVKAAEALLAKGATEVHACCIHPVFSGAAIQRINESPLKSVIVTDSIALRPEAVACEKIKVLSVAPLLAEAIRRIHQSESVSSLFV